MQRQRNMIEGGETKIGFHRPASDSPTPPLRTKRKNHNGEDWQSLFSLAKSCVPRPTHNKEFRS